MRHDFDSVALHDLHVQCLVGIHPHEREEKQPLVVDLTLFFDRMPGGFGSSLNDSLDYSHVAGDVAFLLEAGQFRLLETAAEAICHVILGPTVPDRLGKCPVAVEVQIRKPLALQGKAIPSVSIYRQAEEMTYGLEQNHFGEVDVLHANRDCGIYRLRIPAGGEIPAHFHRTMGEAELVMSSGLLLQGEEVEGGLAHFWPNGFVHQYQNPTQVERSILCVNLPVFDPHDEIAAGLDAPLLPADSYRKRFFGLPQNKE
jgi:FolB domain-containing protein